MRQFNSYSPIITAISFIFGLLMLLYFWLPLILILFIGGGIYVLVALIMSKVFNKPHNFNIKVVKINPHHYKTYQDTYHDETVIDSTTADKQIKKKES